ncbi:MAG: polymer-forming cytoskeletal protein [Akkermansiaceae bacterium]|nr:polymer-forming cytoskeletal protein [Akkermansiaceae bacterium]
MPAPRVPSAPAAASHNPPPPAAPRKTGASTGQRNVLLPDVEINGKVSFQNDLIVDGKIEGEIVSDGSLTIGENAKIKAEIHTRSVIVYGKVHGNITVTERVELRKDAELIGDVKAAVLVMEAGAVFVGSSTVGAPASKSAAASPPKKAADKKPAGPGSLAAAS